ncbi:quiescin Q6 b, partial [Aphelenchoides avenae]
VKTIDDSFMYLWKAHNCVNLRLAKPNYAASDDPQFHKQNFPSNFVCTECQVKNTSCTDEDFNEKAVKLFLVDYFRKIKPYEQ